MTERVCPRCSRKVPDDGRFCPGCGTDLTIAGDEPTTDATAPTATASADPTADGANPWVAAGLSFLLPGVGHVYAGEIGLGIRRLGRYVIGGWGTILLFGLVILPAITVITAGLGSVLYLLLPVYLLLWHAGSAYEAYETALGDGDRAGERAGEGPSSTDRDASSSENSTAAGSSVEGPGGTGLDLETLEEMPYRELQKVAKEVDGLRANRSRAELVAGICRHYGIEEGYTERPADLAELETYSYRELQQLAKELGIKANQTTEDMQADVAEALDLDDASGDEDDDA